MPHEKFSSDRLLVIGFLFRHSDKELGSLSVAVQTPSMCIVSAAVMTSQFLAPHPHPPHLLLQPLSDGSVSVHMILSLTPMAPTLHTEEGEFGDGLTGDRNDSNHPLPVVCLASDNLLSTDSPLLLILQLSPSQAQKLREGLVASLTSWSTVLLEKLPVQDDRRLRCCAM
jgi:hypothetical protein